MDAAMWKDIRKGNPTHHDVPVTVKEFLHLIQEITNYFDTPQSDIEDIIKKFWTPLFEFPCQPTTN